MLYFDIDLLYMSLDHFRRQTAMMTQLALRRFFSSEFSLQESLGSAVRRNYSIMMLLDHTILLGLEWEHAGEGLILLQFEMF